MHRETIERTLSRERFEKMMKQHNDKLADFQKLLSNFICKQTQEMGLHDYYEIKKVVIKAINDLERIW